MEDSAQAEGRRAPCRPPDVEARPTDGPADRGPDMPTGLDDFFGCLRNPERNADKTQSAAAFLLLLILGLIVLAFAAIRPDAGQSTDGQSAPNLSAHEKRLASKAAYRGAPLRRPCVPRERARAGQGMAAQQPRQDACPKDERRARRTIIARSSRSTARDRTIPATTFSMMACAILGMTPTFGAQRRTMAGRLRG